MCSMEGDSGACKGYYIRIHFPDLPTGHTLPDLPTRHNIFPDTRTAYCNCLPGNCLLGIPQLQRVSDGNYHGHHGGTGSHIQCMPPAHVLTTVSHAHCNCSTLKLRPS
jgi:hypothetical protein